MLFPQEFEGLWNPFWTFMKEMCLLGLLPQVLNSNSNSNFFFFFNFFNFFFHSTISHSLNFF